MQKICVLCSVEIKKQIFIKQKSKTTTDYNRAVLHINLRFQSNILLLYQKQLVYCKMQLTKCLVFFVRLFDLFDLRLFGFVLFPLPLGVWEGLRLVIVALPGIFYYLFHYRPL